MKVDNATLTTMVQNAENVRATRDFPHLLTLEEVQADPRQWVGQCPILIENTRNYLGERVEFEKDLDKLEYFFDRNILPIVRTLMPRNPGEPGFVLAGGKVTYLMSKSANYESDCDFFPVGLSDQQADAYIKRLITCLLAISNTTRQELGNVDTVKREIRRNIHYEAERNMVAATEVFLDQYDIYDGSIKVDIYRTPQTITIYAKNGNLDMMHEFQFITRLYASNSEVVSDFDLGPAQMLYDGHQLYMTELGALAYQTGLFTFELDNCVCPSTYARRIRKYLSKGFACLLLYANPEVLESGYTLPGPRIKCHPVAPPPNLIKYHALVVETELPYTVKAAEGNCQDEAEVFQGLTVKNELSQNDDLLYFLEMGFFTDPSQDFYVHLDDTPNTRAWANLRAILQNRAWRVCYYNKVQHNWQLCTYIDRHLDITQFFTMLYSSQDEDPLIKEMYDNFVAWSGVRYDDYALFDLKHFLKNNLTQFMTDHSVDACHFDWQPKVPCTADHLNEAEWYGEAYNFALETALTKRAVQEFPVARVNTPRETSLRASPRASPRASLRASPRASSRTRSPEAVFPDLMPDQVRSIRTQYNQLAEAEQDMVDIYLLWVYLVSQKIKRASNCEAVAEIQAQVKELLDKILVADDLMRAQDLINDLPSLTVIEDAIVFNNTSLVTELITLLTDCSESQANILMVSSLYWLKTLAKYQSTQLSGAIAQSLPFLNSLERQVLEAQLAQLQARRHLLLDMLSQITETPPELDLTVIDLL